VLKLNQAEISKYHEAKVRVDAMELRLAENQGRSIVVCLACGFQSSTKDFYKHRSKKRQRKGGDVFGDLQEVCQSVTHSMQSYLKAKLTNFY